MSIGDFQFILLVDLFGWELAVMVFHDEGWMQTFEDSTSWFKL